MSTGRRGEWRVTAGKLDGKIYHARYNIWLVARVVVCWFWARHSYKQLVLARFLGLLGDFGFTFEEAATLCNTAVGTRLSRTASVMSATLSIFSHSLLERVHNCVLCILNTSRWLVRNVETNTHNEDALQVAATRANFYPLLSTGSKRLVTRTLVATARRKNIEGKPNTLADASHHLKIKMLNHSPPLPLTSLTRVKTPRKGHQSPRPIVYRNTPQVNRYHSFREVSPTRQISIWEESGRLNSVLYRYLHRERGYL